MSIAVRPRFEYANIDATTIAASPLWTLILGAASRPVCILFISNTSATGSFEISFDGVNPSFLVPPGVNGPFEINFRTNNLLLPAGSPLFARLSSGAAGAGSRLAVTYIEEDIQSRGG